MSIALSPSSLNVFLDCPRCFWQDKNEKRGRPRGIFPSLPSGIDRVLKVYFDGYRTRNVLPPDLVGKVRGILVSDRELLKKWRHWRISDLRYTCPTTGALLRGAIDDCLIDGQTYVILDYKTKGGPLKEADILGTWYENQMDCYTLMLQASGRQIGDVAYLVYYYPVAACDNGMFQFTVEPVAVTVDPDRARATVRTAAECLAGPKPAASRECEYCATCDSEGR